MISKLILQDHLNVISNVLNTYKELKIMNTNKNKILNVEITTEEQRNELVKQLQQMEFKKGLPKSWEELETVSGFYIGLSSETYRLKNFNNLTDKGTFKTEKQAKKALAMAQLSQLMYIYNDGWEPDWVNGETKHIIHAVGRDINRKAACYTHYFLSFKTQEIRDEFLKNFEPLIRQFFELD